MSVAYHLRFVTPLEKIKNAEDDNIDVEVVIEGNRFTGTFFTRKNIETIFHNNALSGECASGLFFWAIDMIIVHTINEDVIRKTIDKLLETGEFYRAFSGPFRESTRSAAP